MENKNQTPRRHFYKAMEAKSLKNRSLAAKVAEYLTNMSGRPAFLFLNVIFFAIWIAYNSGVIPGSVPFDEFPFGLLTMIMSIEAIMLSIFVLISQNRASQTATIRDELHLRINLIAEQEITKSLQMLERIEKELKIKHNDKELKEMLQELDTNNLEKSITGQIERADESIFKFEKKEFSNLLSSLTNQSNK